MITVNVLDKDGLVVSTRLLDAAVVEPLFATLAAAPSLATNAFATATKFLAKNTAGQLRAIRATNANAAARYLQVHNLVAVPTANAVPVYSFLIPAGSATNPGVLELTSFFLSGGATFTNGIAVAVSTTLGTFTDAATAGDHIVHAHYV